MFILTIKLRKSPFDLSTSHHAHQELVKGVTTEFSGMTLAFVEIAHWFENVLLLGIVYLFFAWSSPVSPIIGVAVCLLGIPDRAVYRQHERPCEMAADAGQRLACLAGAGFLNLVVLSFIGI